MIKAFPQIIYESYELRSTSKKSSIENIAGFIKQITKNNESINKSTNQ